MDLQLVDINQIQTNPHQPRKLFCDEEIGALADSIGQVGLIHPITVRPLPSGLYELVAGERRLRASRMAGLQKIAVVVRTQTEEHSAYAALIENIQRVDLSAMEVARSLEALMVQFGLTQAQLAQRVGKKRSTVANYLRLLTLPSEVKSSLASGEITMGHAKAILSAGGEEQQKKLWSQIVSKRLTVRGAERQGDLFCDDLARRIENHLGRQAKVEQRRSGRGRIVFDFADYDDLDHLLEQLGVPDAES